MSRGEPERSQGRIPAGRIRHYMVLFDSLMASLVPCLLFVLGGTPASALETVCGRDRPAADARISAEVSLSCYRQTD